MNEGLLEQNYARQIFDVQVFGLGTLEGREAEVEGRPISEDLINGSQVARCVGQR